MSAAGLLWLTRALAVDLVGDQLAVGINADGSLVNDAETLGLLWDPDGPEGAMPTSNDLILPDEPLEAWSLSYTAAGEGWDLIQASPDPAGSDLILDWTSDGRAWAVGTATGDHLAVREALALVDGSSLQIRLTVTALTDLTDLRYARVIDIDPDASTMGTDQTGNLTGDGWVRSGGQWDGRTLALASPGASAAICTDCLTADEVLEGLVGRNAADNAIGLAVALGDLAAGESVSVVVAYALDLSDEQAIPAAQALAVDTDLDDDGAPVDADCDDLDSTSAPGAAERWDGLDNDCDGATDEDTAGTDDDGDGVTEADGDCDDADAQVYPGAAPLDGVVDADCDGVDDDGWDTAAPADKPGGCAVVAGRGVPALLLALSALLLRRRR